jgi:hypothetical protein
MTPKDGLVQQWTIVRHARRLEDEGGIGGCIDGPEAANRVQIPGIGDDGGHSF